MKQADVLPLVMPPRRRGWIDILLLRPLGTSPHTALVMTRRGQLVGVVPAGSTRVLSDYLDWPCEVIEVDGRERRIGLSFQLESCDSGRFFQAELQLIYQVFRPERIALEVDDALGEFEQLIHAALSSTAHPLSLDQGSILKESIIELFQRENSLANRAIALGLMLKRIHVEVEPKESDRHFMEMLKDFQRERPLMWRFYSESLDPRISFEIQVGGFYKIRRHLIPSSTGSGIDEIEFALRNGIERAIRRVAIEFAPQEYREAARAMSEALTMSPVLLAELASAEVDLLRPAVEIQPARPMLADTMRARLALPAPTEATEADSLDWILPPLAALPDARSTSGMPLASEDPHAMLPAESEPDLEPEAELWADEHIAPATFATPELRAAPIEPSAMPNWLVDRALFGAKQPDIEREEHIPEWLRGWDHANSIVTPSYSTPLLTAQEPTLEDPGDHDVTITSEAKSTNTQETEEGETDAKLAEPDEPTQALAQLAPASSANWAKASDISGQVARWMRLLRSDGDEEFERWATILIEQPVRLPAILSGLIRDPATLDHAEESDYQQALADELSGFVVVPTPPPWLSEEVTKSAEPELPDWMQLR